MGDDLFVALCWMAPFILILFLFKSCQDENFELQSKCIEKGLPAKDCGDLGVFK